MYDKIVTFFKKYGIKIILIIGVISLFLAGFFIGKDDDIKGELQKQTSTINETENQLNEAHKQLDEINKEKIIIEDKLKTDSKKTKEKINETLTNKKDSDILIDDFINSWNSGL